MDDSEPRKLNESHESGDDHSGNHGNDGSGGVGANETNESTTTTITTSTTTTMTNTPKPANEERALPRIQIKSPSKLAQEFSEKQKQSDMLSASNETNRTNNNKSSVDLNTTPLYDEPTENRSYSLKETPTSHSFDSQNHETLSSTDTNAVVAESIITDNCEH